MITCIVPPAFFLLANKHQMSYEDVFRHTVSEAAKLAVNVFPTIIYDDLQNRRSQRSDNTAARLGN